MIYMNNKEEQIKVYVMIGTIIMLLVIFSGITYAFFSASNNKGSTSIVEVKSGKMTISYADGKSSLLVSKDIQPSNKIIIDKTFTLTGTNTTSGLAMPYKVGLNYVSEFSDGQIHYYIKRTSANGNITSNLVGTANQTIPGNTTETGYTTGTLKKGNRYLELATGEFKANTSNQTITFNLKIQFPDTGVSQDSEKGKTLTGEIVVNYEETATDTLMALYDKETKTNEVSTSGLFIDDTKDVNLRYTGATPNNYVEFNNETWRIIGIFNVFNNETKKVEKMIKIIRNESLGLYSWDTSNSKVNDGKGINEWSQAKLMYELNTDYIDISKSGTTKWYNGPENAQNEIYEYSKNINSGSMDKIANVKWNTGGTIYGVNVITSYNQERGTINVDNPTDGIVRNSYWNGKIGLLYPSDYGYASSNDICRSQLSSPDCKNNNWIFIGMSQWTITPYKNSSMRSFSSLEHGIINDTNVSNPSSVRPTIFLKNHVKIIRGEGTNSNPYQI